MEHASLPRIQGIQGCGTLQALTYHRQLHHKNETAIALQAQLVNWKTAKLAEICGIHL
jgi:hypothetical protein